MEASPELRTTIVTIAEQIQMKVVTKDHMNRPGADLARHGLSPAHPYTCIYLYIVEATLAS